MLPWADLFRSAIRSGISPPAFWQMSVREWLWLVMPETHIFQVSDLNSLMEAYPDG